MNVGLDFILDTKVNYPHLCKGRETVDVKKGTISRELILAAGEVASKPPLNWLKRNIVIDGAYHLEFRE